MNTLSRRAFLRRLGLAGGLALGAATAGSLLWALTYEADLWMNRQLLAALNDSEPQGVPQTPTIIPREAWGALSPDHDAANEHGFYSENNPEGWYIYQGSLRSAYHTVVIHHPALYTLDNIWALREIQRFQQGERGWADVAYHYFVGRQGAVYAGRDLRVHGVHVAGHNTGSVGVCLLGHFDWQAPTEAQVRSAIRLVRWLAAELDLARLGGHYQLNAGTECPGANLIPFLPVLARYVGLSQMAASEATVCACPAC